MLLNVKIKSKYIIVSESATLLVHTNVVDVDFYISINLLDILSLVTKHMFMDLILNIFIWGVV
jgi:hypothetical protein